MAIENFPEIMFLYEWPIFPRRILDVGALNLLLHSYKLTLVRIWGIFAFPELCPDLCWCFDPSPPNSCSHGAI
jgi:hypothetical protein